MVKARRKVLERALDGRAMTTAMHDTPARRLEQRARYGYWEKFPTNPDRFYERLAGKRNDTFVAKGRSFDVTRRLRDRLAKLGGPQRTPPDRLALYRAFHTVGLELAHRSDDSYGAIGELRLETFETYLAIDWATAGMDPADYWHVTEGGLRPRTRRVRALLRPPRSGRRRTALQEEHGDHRDGGLTSDDG